VEPPGLFRGRGEHPKMGKYKRRIYPRDVTINVGKGVQVEVPEPYRSQGQKWKEVSISLGLSYGFLKLSCASRDSRLS